MLRSVPGSILVIGLLALGVFAAGVGVWWQWQQTRRCLAFYGIRTSERISKAPRVELWRFKRPSDSRHTGHLSVNRVQDITEAKGLVHLRRGLVEDANFKWFERGRSELGPLPDAAWDVALVFYDTNNPDSTRRRAVIAIDFGENPKEANLTVVGSPGRIPLGKMAKGLRTWVESTAKWPE